MTEEQSFLHSSSAYNFFRSGCDLLEEGHPAQAALVLEKAREEEPARGSILEALGRAYFASGFHGKAARRFKEALEVDPTNDYAHYCLGLCYLKLGKTGSAAGHFKVAWTMRPLDSYRRMAARFGARGA